MSVGSALDGIRVLDFSRMMQGPHCSQMLGDMGAEIIKVERVGVGEENRQAKHNSVKGVNAFFLALNRNKKSITINLKDDRGRDIVYRLAQQSDVVLENFRPGAMKRIGLDYETLSTMNPRIVYCSCSGYGQTGPYRGKAGQDLLAQAMSGMMSITGNTCGPPVAAGSYVTDAYAASLATLGITTALFARERTGKGQKVEISLLDAAIHMQCQEATYYLNKSGLPARESPETAHSLEPPPYGTYRTSDKKYVVVSGPWSRVCSALEREELESDPRFESPERRRENSSELLEILRGVFSKKPLSDWLERLEKKSVWCAPVYSYDEVFQDPQVKANRLVISFDSLEAGHIKTIGNPIKMSKTPPTYRTPPPSLGEHTESILSEFGFDREKIKEFRRDGVV